MAYADVAENEAIHQPKSFWTRYVWSQDHKVIAVQYALTAIFAGIVALILSALMRMQIGFPGSLGFVDSAACLIALSMVAAEEVRDEPDLALLEDECFAFLSGAFSAEHGFAGSVPLFSLTRPQEYRPRNTEIEASFVIGTALD